MFTVILLTEDDRGGFITAPKDGFALFLVDDVKHERPRRERYGEPGVRDFVEGVPEEDGLALFRVQKGDTLNKTHLVFVNGDGNHQWREAPWERPWWPRLDADPRRIFIIEAPWEPYTDTRLPPGQTREPPEIP